MSCNLRETVTVWRVSESESLSCDSHVCPAASCPRRGSPGVFQPDWYQLEDTPRGAGTTLEDSDVHAGGAGTHTGPVG